MAKRTSVVREFLSFMRENKAWWTAPIAVVLLLLIGPIALGSTAAAPFIYTLF